MNTSSKHHRSLLRTGNQTRVRIEWAVRQAKDADVPVCLFPKKAKWTACGHRARRVRNEMLAQKGHIVFPITTDPLRASCHLCRKQIRETLFSGAPEAEARAAYNELFYVRDPPRESGEPSPWRPKLKRTVKRTRI